MASTLTWTFVQRGGRSLSKEGEEGGELLSVSTPFRQVPVPVQSACYTKLRNILGQSGRGDDSVTQWLDDSPLFEMVAVTVINRVADGNPLSPRPWQAPLFFAKTVLNEPRTENLQIHIAWMKFILIETHKWRK